MIRKTVYAVLVSLLLFVAGGILLPDEVEVERSLDVKRPPTTLYTVLNRPGTYPEWLSAASPDGQVTFRTDGPVSGIGARIEWAGDPRQWGVGWMEISKSTPGSRVESRIGVEGQGEARSAVHIMRVAGGARLTWVVRSDLTRDRGLFGSQVSRYFGLLFDRWAGSGMEKGLARFRDYAARLPAADFSGLEVERVAAVPLDVLYVHDAAGIREGSPGLAGAFGEISAFMAANDIELAAQPMTLSYAGENGKVRLDAAVPVQRVDIPASGNLRWGRSPSGRAVRAVHHGPYTRLSQTREKLQAWMAAHGYRAGAVSWEHYLSDPGVTPLEEQMTHVYVSLAE